MNSKDAGGDDSFKLCSTVKVDNCDIIGDDFWRRNDNILNFAGPGSKKTRSQHHQQQHQRGVSPVNPKDVAVKRVKKTESET